MNRHLLKQAQELQAKLAKAQKELADMTVEVSSGGGAIKIVIDGQQHVHSVTISPEVISAEDVELLQDMVVAGVNEAIKKSQELAADHLGGLANGLNIPGLF
jgi:DNA-binding YbaB/EbfC family protein